ncbi:DUF7657 domain-containing protein [Paraburkholderia strydomiana]|uniref:Glycosyltransferase RgtA/B/C/D-like domain-containing protein n=1 Tax=Paraburkholderia strydomiana TaxID=1245417 RepID=A0ABW9BWN5_9BURK
MRKLLMLLLGALVCLQFNPAVAADRYSPLAARAFLDSVAVHPAADTLQLSGWAVSAEGKAELPRLHVFVGGQEIYSGQPQREPRADVAKASGHDEWVDAGWITTVPLPKDMPPGPHRLLVQVQFDDEQPLDSRASLPGNEFVDIPSPVRGIPVARSLVFLGAASLLISYLFAPSISCTLSRRIRMTVRPQTSLAAGVVVCFALFVASGVSGSSIHEMEGGALPIQGVKTIVLANTSRLIRSDEWLVLSAMAIGQARHNPPFPVVNSNLGPDGHNMLVVGMTSVPVLSVAALGRPATWGYFLLPLPQAMAWHWWFPVFACVLGLWACLRILFPGQWRIGFLLSFCFVLSPYVVAWSYWPAYVTMFAATAFATVVTLLKGGSRRLNPLLAMVVGVSVSGFALTLYPAWQVPLTYLFVLLLLAVVVRDRRSLRVSVGSFTWLLLGLLLAAIIVGCWWLEARDAVAAMVATVYPGQRSAVPGGDIGAWYLARGFTNFRTLYSDLSPVSNSSEVSSFLYFLLPALVGAIFNRSYTGSNKAIFFGILSFLVLVFWYQYFGFPIDLAKLTLWGRSVPTRADIAVGVAALMLLEVALVKNPVLTDRQRQPLVIERIGAAITALAWVAVVWSGMRHAPEPVASLMDRPHRVLMLLFIGWCSYALAARWSKTFLVSLLALLVFSTAMFNPWTLISTPSPQLTADRCVMGKGRTLVIGSQVPAMALMASGCQVLNGVYYYPQMSLWRALDPERQHANIYNRYQHLFFELGELRGSSSPVLTSPQSDVIRITIDPSGFDFSRLPISYVLVRSNAAMTLSSNRTLRVVASSGDGWTRFEVIH